MIQTLLYIIVFLLAVLAFLILVICQNKTNARHRAWEAEYNRRTGDEDGIRFQ